MGCLREIVVGGDVPSLPAYSGCILHNLSQLCKQYLRCVVNSICVVLSGTYAFLPHITPMLVNASDIEVAVVVA